MSARARGYVLIGFLLVLCAFDIVGCTYSRHAMDNYQACQDDPQCMAQMRIVGNSTADFVDQVLDHIPAASGASHVIAISAGLLGSAVAGVVLGSKLRKKV